MSLFGKWKDKIAHYIHVRLSLIKLSFIERTAGILSFLAYTMVCLFFMLNILLLLGIGLGEWIGELVNSRAGGFFITAGIYLLLVIIIVALRKNMMNAFAGVFINIMTADDDDDDADEQHGDGSAKTDRQ